ncbi:hypothetical protein ACTFIR_009402 [Dictyostelium discoideum]
MDNGVASNELLQLLQPNHNESVKNNDKIEGETLNNRNCYSAQDVIKNIEAIMSYNNVINPVYLIHGTHEVQLEYLLSILDSNILALLKMVVTDWLQTEVAIKLNTQTDITFSRKSPSNPASNAGEKFPMKKDHTVPNHNSHSRNH